MRISSQTYRRITAWALIALIAIVITGGVVRITGSGLGCSDWPTCEDNQLVADLEYHALVEFINRLITGLVAVAVAVAVLGAIWRTPKDKELIRWSWGLVAGVLIQIILGAFVVWYHLTPVLVIMHFLLSMALLLNAVVLYHKSDTGAVYGAHSVSGESGKSRIFSIQSRKWLTRLISAVAAAVVVTGTLVTGSGPHGGDEDVERLGFDISNIARIHAAFVISLITLLGLMGFMIYGNRKKDFLPESGPSATKIKKSFSLLTGIVLAQAFVGYVQYFSDVPEVLVGVHIAGAAFLWSSIIYFHLQANSKVNYKSPSPHRLEA